MRSQTSLIYAANPAAYRPNTDTTSEVHHRYHERLGIPEVRNLAQEVSRTMYSDATRKQIFICTHFITHEAQNALLKTFEEPPQNTELFLVIPADVSLLPTLKSRFVATTHEAQTDTANEIFADFLAESIGARLARIDTILKKKDVAMQRSLKAGLLTYLTDYSGNTACLQSLGFVAEKLLTRGASNKMLLEELALSLPAD